MPTGQAPCINRFSWVCKQMLWQQTAGEYQWQQRTWYCDSKQLVSIKDSSLLDTVTTNSWWVSRTAAYLMLWQQTASEYQGQQLTWYCDSKQLVSIKDSSLLDTVTANSWWVSRTAAYLILWQQTTGEYQGQQLTWCTLPAGGRHQSCWTQTVSGCPCCSHLHTCKYKYKQHN